MDKGFNGVSDPSNSQRKADDVDLLVGRNLKECRRAMKLSQKDLGAALGISYQQVQKYESGANRISAGRLYSIAALLGLQVEDFFEGAGALDAASRPSLVHNPNYPALGDSRLEGAFRDLMSEVARSRRGTGEDG